jgi:hypothetical protein
VPYANAHFRPGIALGLNLTHFTAQGGSSGTADQKYEEAKQKAAEAVRETVGSDPRTSGGQRDMANKAYDAAADTVRTSLLTPPPGSTSAIEPLPSSICNHFSDEFLQLYHVITLLWLATVL